MTLRDTVATVAGHRLDPDELFSLTSNHHEHSLVISTARWEKDVRPAWHRSGMSSTTYRVQPHWSFFRIDCPEDGLDFGIVGLLHRILTVLTAAEISILAIGTYLTDYVMLDLDKVMPACRALRAAGWPVYLDGQEQH